MRVFHADALVLGDRPPLRDGALVVGSDGAILDVGAAVEVLPRHAGLPVERVRGVALPGLVNAHTHLELSALRGRVAGGAGFIAWVEQLIGARVETGLDEVATAIEESIDDLDAFCTAAVGEVSNSLGSVAGLARRGIAGCIFHEVFGVDPAAVDRRVDALATDVEERVGAWPTRDLAYAPTPHTLYTTHPDGVRRLLAEARARGGRASLHLAEHAGERRFLEKGEGPVAAWAESRMKIPRDRLEWPAMSPVAFADALGALRADVLLVHLTDASAEELALVASRGSPVVLCPRSNLFIEARHPPLLAVRDAGIAPALGTDSLASNASLDVLREARALADRFSTVPAAELVAMATWGGARALGREDLGRLARGARPGVFAIDGDPGDDPCAFVLRGVGAPRRWLLRRGATE